MAAPKHPLSWITSELAAWRSAGLGRTLAARQTRQGAIVELDGRSLVNFGSNDYLGLASDPRLADAVRASVAKHGWGAGAAPLVTGRSDLHAELEQSLARFEGTERALLFPTGFAANLGTVSALVGPGDTIFSDARNHASLIDGCRLSRATVVVYPHRDLAALERELQQAPPTRRLIVTDTVFSMDGDLAPLPRLVDLAESHDAMLMVDEAHATGVFGERGTGIREAQGVAGRVPVCMGTLSKGLGSIGGFVSGSNELIEWLLNRARAYVFSTALPAAACAASLAALRIVEEEPGRRVRVRQLADWLRARLIEQGWNVGASESQIVPIIVGEPQRTMELSQRLRERGFWIPGIRPPTVPQGESLLRIGITAGHSQEMLDQLVKALDSLPRDGR